MKTMRYFFYLALVGFVAIAGCAKKENTPKKTPLKPFEAVQTEAQTMSLGGLQQTAHDLVVQIIKGKEELKKDESVFNALSPEDQAGAKGNALKEKISQIRSDVNARALRYQVYAEKIRKSNAVPPTFGSVIKEMKQS